MQKEGKNSEFEVKKGPIFANLILADEVNRAPAKVQSALLESMQSILLDIPFWRIKFVHSINEYY